MEDNLWNPNPPPVEPLTPELLRKQWMAALNQRLQPYYEYMSYTEYNRRIAQMEKCDKSGKPCNCWFSHRQGIDTTRQLG